MKELEEEITINSENSVNKINKDKEITEAIKDLTETIKSIREHKKSVLKEGIVGRNSKAISCQCIVTSNINVHDNKTVCNLEKAARISSSSDKSSSSESDSAISGSDGVISISSQEDYLEMASCNTYNRYFFTILLVRAVC